LFVIFLIFKRKQAHDRSDIVKVRNKRAAKLSRNRLKSAKKLVRDNKDAQVYDEVLRALWQYLGDKLAIDQSRLNRERVFEEMREREVSEELISKVAELADLCEMARYAPTAVKTKSAEVYSQAVDLLVQLERAIK
jgi:Zn-dependent oligopeptidase